MPFYRYECANGHTNKRMRTMDERNQPATCDECDHEATRDMIGEHEQKNAHVFVPYVDYNLKADPVEVQSYSHKEKLKDEAGVREKGSYVE